MKHNIIALLAICCASTGALAAAPGNVVECRHKAFPNLPGENLVLLARQGAGAFKLTVGSQGSKPREFRVRCTFHAQDAGTFYCAERDRHGFFSNRTRELSVSTDRKAQTFAGYTFQAVRSPLGDPREFISLRFAREPCRAGGK